MAYQHVRDQLDSLLGKQHIQEKSRSRQGTTYVVLLPDQILGATIGITTCDLNPYELDHYNAAERRSLIAERDGWRCFYCFAMLDAGNYTLDHIEPKSQGHQADHTPRNLVTACGPCNSSRRDRPIEDFLRDCYRRRLLDQDDLQGQLAYLELVKSDQREIPTVLSGQA